MSRTTASASSSSSMPSPRQDVVKKQKSASSSKRPRSKSKGQAKYAQRIAQHMDIAFLDDACAPLDVPTTPEAVPKLIVYDLDDTIWFPELYMIAGAPFAKDATTKKITDSAGVELKQYPAARASVALVDAHEIFERTKIAVASRTHRGQWARTLLTMFEVSEDGARTLADCIAYVDIASGSKKKHFERLRAAADVDYADMLFFDNERENCVDVAQLGVACVHCPGGMTADAWSRGLALFAATR